MAENSYLGTRLCIAWKTRIPFQDTPRTSRKFLLQGAEWYLSFILALDASDNNSHNRNYIVFLNSGDTNVRLEQSFTATTFIQSPRNTSELILMSNSIVVENTKHKIWKEEQMEIQKHISGFLDYGELVIIVQFDLPIKASSNFVNETTHIWTQTDFALPELSSNQCTQACLFPEFSSDKYTQACLALPSDLESLSLDFCNLLEHETLPDVKLRCKDRSFSAHRTVLSARSEVFAAMFRNKMTESEIVDVADLDASALDLFLKYLYSGKIQDLSEDTAHSLYAAGDKYAVHCLKKACSEWMIRHLAKENCLGLLILADRHSDEGFKDTVVNFVAVHLQELNGESWTRFKRVQPRLSLDVYDRFAQKVFQTCRNDTRDPYDSSEENILSF